MKIAPENTPETAPAKHRPDTDEKSWATLHERIRTLALRRSDSLLKNETADDDEMDRGARTLRLLMSSAEITRRMKDQDEKEKTEDGDEEEPVTDEQIEDLYWKIERTVDRIEGEEQAEGEKGEAVQRISAGKSGAGMEKPCP